MCMPQFHDIDWMTRRRDGEFTTKSKKKRNPEKGQSRDVWAYSQALPLFVKDELAPPGISSPEAMSAASFKCLPDEGVL